MRWKRSGKRFALVPHCCCRDWESLPKGCGGCFWLEFGILTHTHVGRVWYHPGCAPIPNVVIKKKSGKVTVVDA